MITKEEQKRIKELEKMKKEMGEEFSQERQGELDGLLLQKEQSS